MSTHHPDGRPVEAPAPPATALEKILRSLSVVTMLMTVPQVYAIWVARNASGVSILSWASYLVSACLWFVYGFGKKDKTIYLACIGWIVLDAAIVVGIIVRG
ncbi:MAG: SemiSWEET family transporter [Caldimonas sp.]